MHRILKEIFTEKTRVILTIIAIAWGTIAISIMLAVGQGLRVTFKKGMDGIGQNVVYVMPGTTSTNYQGQGLNQPVTLRPEDYYAIAKKVSDIKVISPEYAVKGAIQQGSFRSMNGTIKAVNPVYHQIRNIKIATPGRFINELDMKQASRVIVLGNKIAEQLFKNHESALHRIVYINNWPYQVIGIMKAKVQMTMMNGNDSYEAWIPTSTFMTYNHPTELASIVYNAKENSNTENIKNQIREIIAFNHQFDPQDQSLVRFIDFQNIQQDTASFFLGLQLFLGIVGVLTLIVAGVGITNVMYVSVANSTKEIGIRMAIGARTNQILLQYILEALVVTFIGGVVGFILSFLIVLGMDQIPLTGGMFQYMGKPYPELSINVVLSVIFCLGLVGFFAGFFPARKASKILPAIALRHEKG